MESSSFGSYILEIENRDPDFSSVKKKNTRLILGKIRQTTTLNFCHLILLFYGHFLAQKVFAGLSYSFSSARFCSFEFTGLTVVQVPSLDKPAFRA
jgi:hypothetical protein